jgi:hypothetical protein
MTPTVVRSIEPAGERWRMVAGVEGSRCAVTVASEPDVEAAEGFLRGVRRVDAVEVSVSDGVVTCRVAGVGHRLPFRRRVPVAVGLGLGLLGVPVLLELVDGGPSPDAQPQAELVPIRRP